MEDNDLFGTLDQALARHDARKAELLSRERERKLSERARLDNFDQLFQTLVRPVMEEIGTYVEAKGHQCKITDTGAKDERGYRLGGEVTIEFKFHPKGYVSDNNHANISTFGLRGTSRSDTIFLHRGTMHGPAGSMGGNPIEIHAEQITADFVKQNLVGLITDILDKN